jgi:hypothetical protein
VNVRGPACIETDVRPLSGPRPRTIPRGATSSGGAAVHRALVLTAATLAAGCATFTPRVEEPLRLSNLEDASPAALGLEPGSTLQAAALASMSARGLTGVVSTTDELFGLGAVGADFQRSVHVFRRGRYWTSVRLDAGVGYGLALGFARQGSRRFLLVVQQDPLDRPGGSDRLTVFEVDEAEPFEPVRIVDRVSLSELAARHEGLSRPHLVGSSLEDGVLLLGRDREGRVWDESFVVRLESEKVVFTPRALSDAARCGCVVDYIRGVTVKRANRP